MIRILAYGLLLIIAIAAPNASAVVAEKTQPKHIANEKKEKSSSTETLTKENTETLSKISASAQAYKDNPSNETYTALWQDFENWLRQLNAKHADASSSCKSCAALDKAGLKIIDAAGSGATIKIYA